MIACSVLPIPGGQKIMAQCYDSRSAIKGGSECSDKIQKRRRLTRLLVRLKKEKSPGSVPKRRGRPRKHNDKDAAFKKKGRIETRPAPPLPRRHHERVTHAVTPAARSPTRRKKGLGRRGERASTTNEKPILCSRDRYFCF